ncbi:MAG TPA: alpha/beta hydrolase [Frankiaceae bacterium]|nr:alpha/beta hydrolase [Frankiaceae bacterium]
MTGRVGGVEYVVVGSGSPVTVFAHGLGGSIAETRPLATDLGGTRVLLHFRGHGDSAPLADGWDYDMLADDLRAVADRVGATRALGLSLGAGALLRLLSTRPDRFERVAFVLPAALDRSRSDGATARLDRLADAMRVGNHEQLVALLLAEVPAELRDSRAAQVLTVRRARQLAFTEPPYPRPGVRPLDDVRILRSIGVPALVLAQEGDDLHTVTIAQTLSDALPDAAMHVLPPGGVFWTDRFRARTLLAEHLTGSSGSVSAPGATSPASAEAAAGSAAIS